MKQNLSEINPVYPKCGNPYLYLKDWGRTGALFVHAYDTDAASEERHKVACQVPEHVAMAIMKMEEWHQRNKSE